MVLAIGMIDVKPAGWIDEDEDRELNEILDEDEDEPGAIGMGKRVGNDVGGAAGAAPLTTRTQNIDNNIDNPGSMMMTIASPPPLVTSKKMVGTVPSSRRRAPARFVVVASSPEKKQQSQKKPQQSRPSNNTTPSRPRQPQKQKQASPKYNKSSTTAPVVSPFKSTTTTTMISPLTHNSHNSSPGASLESASSSSSQSSPLRRYRSSSFSSPPSRTFGGSKLDKVALMEKEHVEQLLSMRRVMIDMHLSSEDRIQSLQDQLKEVQMNHDLLHAQQQVQRHDREREREHAHDLQLQSEGEKKRDQAEEAKDDASDDNDEEGFNTNLNRGGRSRSRSKHDTENNNDSNHRVKELELKLAELQESLADATEQTTKDEQNSSQVHLQLEEMERTQQELQVSVKDRDMKLAESQQQVKDRDEHVAHLKSLLAKQSSQTGGAGGGIVDQRDLVSPAQYRQQVVGLEESIQALNETHTDEQADLQSTIGALEAQYTLIQTCMAELEKDLATAKEENDRKAQELHFKDEAIENAENIIAFLEESKDELQAQYDALTMETETASNMELESVSEPASKDEVVEDAALEGAQTKLTEMEVEHQSKLQELEQALEEQTVRGVEQHQELKVLKDQKIALEQDLLLWEANANQQQSQSHPAEDYVHEYPPPLSMAASMPPDVPRVVRAGAPSTTQAPGGLPDRSKSESYLEIEHDHDYDRQFQRQHSKDQQQKRSEAGRGLHRDGSPSRSLKMSAPWAQKTPAMFPRTFPIPKPQTKHNFTTENDRVIANINTDDFSDVDSEAGGPSAGIPAIFNCGEGTFHDGGSVAAAWMAPFFSGGGGGGGGNGNGPPGTTATAASSHTSRRQAGKPTRRLSKKQQK
jgi:hypothetical protein